MKKTFALIFLSAVFVGMSTTASALGFSTVISDDKSKNTFTKCSWESDPHLNKVPLKGKPGKSDHVWIRPNGKEFVIDVSPTIGSISILYAGTTIMEGKTLQTTKGGMHFASEANPRANAVLTAKKSTIGIRGNLSFDVWEKHKSMGGMKINLEDSKMDISGALSYNVPAWNAKFTRNCSGVTITLAGASYIKCKGEMLIDSLLADSPDMHFRYILNEKDGKMPFVSTKGGSINACELHLNIKGKLRKGIYPLIESTGAKEYAGKFRAMTLNGKNISLNNTTSINGMDVVVKLGSADKRKANDYVLEVK